VPWEWNVRQLTCSPPAIAMLSEYPPDQPGCLQEDN